MLRDYDNYDVLIILKSVQDPDYPPLKKVVRAEVINSGYAFKKLPNNLIEFQVLS